MVVRQTLGFATGFTLCASLLAGGCSSPVDEADARGGRVPEQIDTPSEPVAATPSDDAVTTGGQTAPGAMTPIAQPDVPESAIITEPPVPFPSQEAEAAANAACATASVESKVGRSVLLMALDRSGTMGALGAPALRALRWTPVTAALKAFVADPASAGLNASLEFFPETGMGLCSTAAYRYPDVPLAALPSETFAAVIGAAEPKGRTPTLSALLGVAAYGDQLLAEDSSTQVAIALITSGLPSSYCTDPRSTLESVTEAAAMISERFPIHVIGVGRDLENLTKIAEAGGTEEALLINADDPEGTRSALFERLGAIREQVASCEVPIPAPPEGKTFEPLKVNTQVRLGNAAAAADVAYSANCDAGAGWRYDDFDLPTQIVLCPDTCDAVRQHGSSAIDVVFGCTTNLQIVRPVR